MTISNGRTRAKFELGALWFLLAATLSSLPPCIVVDALIPFLDGGKDIPKLYNGYFDSQIAKQAATAVGAAISSGKTNIEVNLPAVPNVEEVRFGYVKTIVNDPDLSLIYAATFYIYHIFKRNFEFSAF